MKIRYQGRDIEVEVVEVVVANDPWNEYQLADGKVLSIKIVLVDVMRAIDEKGLEGMPLYITKTHHVVKVK